MTRKFVEILQILSKLQCSSDGAPNPNAQAEQIPLILAIRLV
jgi:hypothetical protein